MEPKATVGSYVIIVQLNVRVNEIEIMAVQDISLLLVQQSEVPCPA